MDWDDKIDSARPDGEPSRTSLFEKSGGLGNPTDTPDADLLAERDAFYATHPYESFKASIDAKMETETPWWKRLLFQSSHGKWFATALAGAAAAMIAFIIIPDNNLPPEAPHGETLITTPAAPNPGIRMKGQQPRTVIPEAAANKSIVQLSLKTHSDVETVIENGSRLLPDQRISFSYASSDLDHLFLVGINDKQEPSALYPANWDQASIKIAPGDFPLKHKFVLDSYLGHERFIAIFSREPISGNDVQKAAENAIKLAEEKGGGVLSIKRLPLAADCAQTSVLIEKVAN